MNGNTRLVLVSGKSATGKTASTRTIENHPGVMYLNCENNKDLPFPGKFEKYTVTDPKQVPQAIAYAESLSHIHTIIIDTLTFMMNMFESLHVMTAANTQKAWGEYAQFFQNMMSQEVAKSTKNIIFLAHTVDQLNQKEMVMETFVKVKGSLMNQGIESFFSTVISTKKLPLKDLENYSSPLLNISDMEKRLGFKYVFQTQLTEGTVNERIRSPIGMWAENETFIDNNMQLVINRLDDYYQ